LQWSKGYVRQATALFYQQKYKDAVTVYAQGLGRDPSSRLLADGLAAAQKHLAESATDQGQARSRMARRQKWMDESNADDCLLCCHWRCLITEDQETVSQYSSRHLSGFPGVLPP
jgi:hypothetical protein